MEPNYMREILAKRCMGWHKGMGHETSAQMDALPCYRSADGKFQVLWCKWIPDKFGTQALLVMKAMRAKEWRMNVYMGGPGYTVSFHELDRAGMMGSAYAHTFPEAVSLAAYRALESEESDGT